MGAVAGMLTLPVLPAAVAMILFVITGVGAVIVGERWGRRHPPRLTPLWRSPPSATFHLTLIAPAVVLLIAVSVPTGIFLPLIAARLALLIAAVLWAGRVVLYVLACVRRVAHGTPVWLVAAPLAGAVVVALVVADAPLRARWILSRTAFEAAVESGEPQAGQLGLFEIRSVSRQDEAVWFTETHTGLFTSGGFAYLPDGPSQSAGMGEWSEYRHLGGPWYAWTAGW
jgi:hypothetical protein